MTNRDAEHLSLPADSEAVERLAPSGLEYALIDGSDVAPFGHWFRAEARGFHDTAPTDEEIARASKGTGDRRTTGVWDAASALPEVPVATIASWPVELTVPGATSVTAWAISSVTVSPTHRRKGIARAMLEAELRAASALGLPVAILTVSEATIYGRYGFAPTAMAASWTIDMTRAKWSGPAASGTVTFVSATQLRSQGPELFERARLKTPGDIVRWDSRWDDLLQLADQEKGRKLRFVRYDDADGTAQGFAVYSMRMREEPVRTRTLEVDHLVSVTDDAYAGLWRFLLEQDLVDEVVAPLRRVDEPVVWQVSNRRAIRKSDERDHLWTRILDVAGVLHSRRYSADGRLVIEVSDDLGYAAGRYLIEVVGRLATVSRSSEPAAVALAVNELSALSLGGVSAAELLHAGRMTQHADGAVDTLDAMFRTPTAPWLSIWF